MTLVRTKDLTIRCGFVLGHLNLSILGKGSHKRPWARSHLHSAGPRPSHVSFIAWSSCPNLHGNSSSLGTNVTIPNRNYKFSSGHHFHYFQVNRWRSFTYIKLSNKPRMTFSKEHQTSAHRCDPLLRAKMVLPLRFS